MAALSIWALVAGHWSTWQAARVEVTQQEEATEREQHPVEQKVVKVMIAKTDVSRFDCDDLIAAAEAARRCMSAGCQDFRPGFC